MWRKPPQRLPHWIKQNPRLTLMANELAKLYFQRCVELHFRRIKTVLSLDTLRYLKPRMVLKKQP
jgi:hypothetical protein